jgi:uncharacterized protein YecE (DUF72 family)
MKNKIYIGTSGWSYCDWSDGEFYPKNLKERDWLTYYSQHFKTVEINATFYHQMSVKTYQNWYRIVPKDFIFSVKISRFLTHVKKLNQPREPWQRFINNAKHLKEKLGPILVQLPPNFKMNCERLINFFKAIERSRNIGISRREGRDPELALRVSGLRHTPQDNIKIALEVRDESWLCNEVYQILKKYNCALVFADSEPWPDLRRSKWQLPITANFIYIRMHGPGDLYGSKYTTPQLKKVAQRIKLWQRKAKQIYVYFNNDTDGYAVENANKLIELLKQ